LSAMCREAVRGSAGRARLGASGGEPLPFSGPGPLGAVLRVHQPCSAGTAPWCPVISRHQPRSVPLRKHGLAGQPSV